MANESPAPKANDSNQAQEGAQVTGNVNTGGGDFIGRDQIANRPTVEAGGVAGVVLTDVSAGGDIRIEGVYASITYQTVLPQPVDEATVQAAQARAAGKVTLGPYPPCGDLAPWLANADSVNALFVGREAELQRLAVALQGQQTVAVGQMAAATGLGGIGKTQLAVAFVHHYGQYFAGGVYWLNCADPNAIPNEIATCGLTMPEVRADFATLDVETRVRLVLAAWQNPLPRLLVFDNCEWPAVLAQWRPPTGGCRLLITSRRPSWDIALGVTLVALDTLARAESVALLRKFRPELPATDSQLDAIAAELGDLPLALHLAGSYLARYRRAVSPAQYLTQLRQPDLLHHRSLQASVLWPDVDQLSPTKHVQHVARTFALSYDQLQSADLIDALARALLARAAWFAPGQLIPIALLLTTIERNEETALQAEDALQRLTNLGLVEQEGDDDLLLHRLVMHFVQQVDAEATPVAQEAVAAALLAEANRLNNAGIPGPLLAWQSHLRHITDFRKDRGDTQAAALCNTLGFHLDMIGDYGAARPYYERALAITEEVLGAHDPDTASSLNNLGALLQAMGDYGAARPYFERALAITEEVLGATHPATATSLNNLGALLRAMGDYGAARLYFERALAITEEVLGATHPDTASSLNNLGGLLHTMGDYGTARPYYERALAIYEEVVGAHHPDTALSLNNLGGLLDSMGDYGAARPYYERALAIYEEVVGAHHPDTALSLNNLGGLLDSMGDYGAARPYYERALAIREAVVGAHHPDTASSLNNLGGLLHAMGEYGAAQPYYERALAIREEVLGANHPDTAQSLNNLGGLLDSMGDYGAARPYYERALAIREAVVGAHHPATATSLNNLGYLLQAMGDYGAARPYFERALAIFEERLGPSHPYTETVRRNLSVLEELL